MSGFPFVSVEKYQGKAVVRVRIAGRSKRYPLTKAGCLEAGHAMFKAGVTVWVNSSSVDFPREAKPWFKHDVRTLLRDGLLTAAEAAKKVLK